MNFNLFDLLWYFRCPEDALLPYQFPSAERLGEYSYVENKVFPLDNARASRVAKTLLRKIGQFEYHRTVRFEGGPKKGRGKKSNGKSSKTTPRESVDTTTTDSAKTPRRRQRKPKKKRNTTADSAAEASADENTAANI
jgi:hypothetical protein